jgi:segregation and condensation protein B
MEIVDSVMALLFVADEPVKSDNMARILGVAEGQVEQAVEILQERLTTQGGPLQVIRLAGGWQLCTRPECAEIVAAFLKPQRQRLGRSLMEVLAIVAYKQPVTMAEVDLARGVQSDYSLRQLIERRLIEEVGRKQTPGRPVLYGTTQQFLHQFNLDSIEGLPELSAELADMATIAALTGGEEPLPEDTETDEADDDGAAKVDEPTEETEDPEEDSPSSERPHPSAIEVM